MSIQYSEETLTLLGGPVIYPLHTITYMFLIMQEYSSFYTAMKAIKAMKMNSKENQSILGSREQILDALDYMMYLYTHKISIKKVIAQSKKDWLVNKEATPKILQASQNQSSLVEDIVTKKFHKWISTKKDISSYSHDLFLY